MKKKNKYQQVQSEIRRIQREAKDRVHLIHYLINARSWQVFKRPYPNDTMTYFRAIKNKSLTWNGDARHWFMRRYGIVSQSPSRAYSYYGNRYDPSKLDGLPF